MIIDILVALFIARSSYLTVIDQKQFMNNLNFAKDDPKLASHVIEAVDWVYNKTQGEGFKAYNYVPEIYDYPYQYIYWWYGRKTYGYMPEKIEYEPDVVSYIPRQVQFLENTKLENNKIALIYEKKANWQSWLDKFDNWCLIEKNDFEWNVGVEIRQKCK